MKWYFVMFFVEGDRTPKYCNMRFDEVPKNLAKYINDLRRTLNFEGEVVIASIEKGPMESPQQAIYLIWPLLT